jgi:hypothetical protein
MRGHEHTDARAATVYVVSACPALDILRPGQRPGKVSRLPRAVSFVLFSFGSVGVTIGRESAFPDHFKM